MDTYFDYGAAFAEQMKEEMGCRILCRMRKPYPMPDTDILEVMECNGLSQPDDEQISEFWEGYNSSL